MEKEAAVFDKSPDERIIENIQKYENLLTSNENGWILSVETEAAGGFNHWVSFDGKNRVKMLSDAEAYNSKYFPGSSTEVIESSYSFNHMQNVVLSFDTYNYLHMLCDPQGSVNGGENSEGLVSDFQFYIKGFDENDDMIMEGRYNNSHVVVQPCSAEQKTAIDNGGLKSMHDSFNDFIGRTVNEMDFPVFEMDGKKIVLSLSSRSVSMEYLDPDGNIVKQSSGAYLGTESLSGDVPVSNLNLFTPIEINGVPFNGMVYSDGKYMVSVGENLLDFKDNGQSVFPLDFGIGREYSEIEITPEDLEGTIREPFLSDVLQKSIDGFNDFHGGARVFRYFVLSFEDDEDEGPIFSFRITYLTVSTGKSYSYYHYYTFVENEDGSVTFTSRKPSSSSSKKNSEEALKPFLDYFCEIEYDNSGNIVKTTPKTFNIRYAPNKTPGLSGGIGAFYPVDNEECYCPGVLG